MYNFQELTQSLREKGAENPEALAGHIIKEASKKNGIFKQARELGLKDGIDYAKIQKEMQK